MSTDVQTTTTPSTEESQAIATQGTASIVADEPAATPTSGEEQPSKKKKVSHKADCIGPSHVRNALRAVKDDKLVSADAVKVMALSNQYYVNAVLMESASNADKRDKNPKVITVEDVIAAVKVVSSQFIKEAVDAHTPQPRKSSKKRKAEEGDVPSTATNGSTKDHQPSGEEEEEEEEGEEEEEEEEEESGSSSDESEAEAATVTVAAAKK